LFDISEPINIQDVHKAPDKPGLYVWYARLSMGKADWHVDYSGGENNAKASFLRVLQDHSMKFCQQEISVTAFANFSTEWKGLLEEKNSSRWRKGLEVETSCGEPSALSCVASQNHTREALIELINSSFPIFHSPLYLGRAVDQTLKERLKQHKNAFLDLWERYLRDRETISRINKPNDFAGRAIKLGFRREDLFCYTLTLNKSHANKLTTEELNAVITFSEWILNRWTTPILGRQ